MIRRRYSPDTPCIAAGQSMGGLIATHLVLRDQSAWAGLILCSAAIDVEWNLVLRSDILTHCGCFSLDSTILRSWYCLASSWQLILRKKRTNFQTCRIQAPIGGLLATLLPRAKIVPAVALENLSNSPAVVSSVPISTPVSAHTISITCQTLKDAT